MRTPIKNTHCEFQRVCFSRMPAARTIFLHISLPATTMFLATHTICWCLLLRFYHIGDVSVSLKSGTVGLGAPPISLLLAHLIRFHCRAIVRVARESDIVATRVSTRDLRRWHVLRRISFATACNAFVIRQLYTTSG